MQKRFDRLLFLRDALVVTVAVIAAAFLGVIIATNGRIDRSVMAPAISAAAAGILVYLPGIALRSCCFLKLNRFLAALAWRLPTSLAVLPLVYLWQGLPRKCFVFALMTCYFVGLALESWLQMKQCGVAANREKTAEDRTA